MKPIARVMRMSPVIPVLVIDDVAQAQPIAKALVAGGLRVLEVTLRTPAALEVIAEMKQVDGAIVGAGTVVDLEGLDRALGAGADFIVSPGLTARLGAAAVASGVAFLPGVATAGDIMRGLELGLSHFKFFPAEASGGLPALKSLIGPFGNCRFCPTGGITPEKAPEWLAQPEVFCVGGSWLVPKGGLDLARIESLARAAAAFSRASEQQR